MESFIEGESIPFQDLPERPPYGFWISPQGVLYPVQHMGHIRAARKLIYEICPEFEEPEDHRRYAISEELMKRGWIRVRLMGRIYVEYIKEPNTKQRRNAKDIGAFYRWPQVVYDKI